MYDPLRQRRMWLDEHYDVLQELYKQFKTNGQTVFGRSFFQCGSFADFIEFVHRHMFIDADLLSAKSTTSNVRALGPRSRDKCWVHDVQGQDDRVAAGSGGEGVGRCWGRGVVADATGGGERP